ncbi:hypothetical protein ZWY2020_052155 [Hordeum vulgare]|nr:hypothetical protein ZWY2020_052155 [Hordeum vulgare]
MAAAASFLAAPAPFPPPPRARHGCQAAGRPPRAPRLAEPAEAALGPGMILAAWRVRAVTEFSREYDGACLQMRLSFNTYSLPLPCVGGLASLALGLMRILIYKVYVDGTTTMSTHERKDNIKEFYAVKYFLLCCNCKEGSLIWRTRSRRPCAWRGRRNKQLI